MILCMSVASSYGFFIYYSCGKALLCLTVNLLLLICWIVRVAGTLRNMPLPFRYAFCAWLSNGWEWLYWSSCGFLVEVRAMDSWRGRVFFVLMGAISLFAGSWGKTFSACAGSLRKSLEKNKGSRSWVKRGSMVVVKLGLRVFSNFSSLASGISSKSLELGRDLNYSKSVYKEWAASGSWLRVLKNPKVWGVIAFLVLYFLINFLMGCF